MLRKMFILFFISFVISGCASDENSLGAMIVSVSSDGNYIISNAGKRIILWDIKNKQKKLISDNGNIYSPYFIKHSPYFMWQDLNNIIHVQDINGREILSFKNFPVYGQVMTSDLKHYFTSDVDWTIFSGYGKDQKQIKIFCSREKDSFYGYQKLFNLILSDDNKYLISSGSGSAEDDKIPLSYGMCEKLSILPDEIARPVDSVFNGTILWKISTEKPLFKIDGLVEKSIATISPNGKYIVAGDENDNAFIWNVKTRNKTTRLDDPTAGYLEEKPDCQDDGNTILSEGGDLNKYGGSYNKCKRWIKDEIIDPPSNYLNESPRNDIFALKFIGLNGDFLRFNADKHYAILYNVNNRRPLKYLYLGKTPDLVTMTFYDHNEAIDTAPEANILVIAKRYTTGIIVYKYDPQKQTLAKIWSPDFYSWWGEIRERQKDNSAYTNQKSNSTDPDFVESLMTTKYKKKN
jgi:WD40 repeat protein